jgi:hypothetical protein
MEEVPRRSPGKRTNQVFVYKVNSQLVAIDAGSTSYCPVHPLHFLVDLGIRRRCCHWDCGHKGTSHLQHVTTRRQSAKGRE